MLKPIGPVLTKLVHELAPGDRVQLSDGTVKTVRSNERGFAKCAYEGEKLKTARMIEYTDGEWSQPHPDDTATLA